MSGDDENIDPETPETSETVEGFDTNLSDVETESVDKHSKKSRLLPLVGGLLIAVGAGGIGGFAAHEYFKAPPVAPDLSAFDVKFSEIEKTVAAQSQRMGRLETDIKEISAGLNKDLEQLETNWSRELSDLENLIESPSPQLGDQVEAPAKSASDDDDVSGDKAVEETSEPPSPSLPDIRPQLLAAVADIRREFDQDISNINKRIDTLEATQAAPDVPTTSLVRFPTESFIAQLEGDALPVEQDSRLGKFLKKHVSLNRTGHAEAVSILERIGDYIAAGHWDAAEELSDDLPPEVQSVVQEWIAGARP